MQEIKLKKQGVKGHCFSACWKHVFLSDKVGTFLLWDALTVVSKENKVDCWYETRCIKTLVQKYHSQLGQIRTESATSGTFVVHKYEQECKENSLCGYGGFNENHHITNKCIMLSLAIFTLLYNFTSIRHPIAISLKFFPYALYTFMHGLQRSVNFGNWS